MIISRALKYPDKQDKSSKRKVKKEGRNKMNNLYSDNGQDKFITLGDYKKMKNEKEGKKQEKIVLPEQSEKKDNKSGYLYLLLSGILGIISYLIYIQ